MAVNGQAERQMASCPIPVSVSHSPCRHTLASYKVDCQDGNITRRLAECRGGNLSAL